MGYNATLVLIVATMLGAVSGLLGSFIVLRRQALLADCISHAALPGVVAAFLLSGRKELTLMLIGAIFTAALSALFVQLLAQSRRISAEHAIAISLSSFFGLGVLLLGIAQHSGGDAAGLNHFILGELASVTMIEGYTIGVLAVCLFIAVFFAFNQFKMLCFDREYFYSIESKAILYEMLLSLLILIITVLALKAAGVLLTVAMLTVPAAVARLVATNLVSFISIATLTGIASAIAGVSASTYVQDLPTGAAIVLSAGIFFLSAAIVVRFRRA